MRPRAVLLWLALVAVASSPANASTQDDAGSGADAGNTFETATAVVPLGPYAGTLDAASGDTHDYLRFRLEEGQAVSVAITISEARHEPITLLDPNGVVVDAGTHVSTIGVSPDSIFTTFGVSTNGTSDETRVVRVGVHRALVAGDYRLHLQSELIAVTAYSLCFMNCEPTMEAPSQLIFGGSLKHLDTRVLLIPPAHGDLGNPLGPTVVDYLDATLRGIHAWTRVMHDFADAYPEYSYLKEITVDIEIFDGVSPVDPAGFDVLIGYVAAGPVFRGVAGDPDDSVEQILESAGLDEEIHYSGRVIALSLFGAAPRAGQVVWDFPEVTDLEIVTMHEFGHTFGLGHTRWWDPVLGPDLMNSPAPFIYGDGFPLGDGGQHTAMKCLSTVNLIGMAELYWWVPSGYWRGTGGWAELPDGMPYAWFC